MLETFVAGEILRLATWSEVQSTCHHYRDKDQDEVDILLEDEAGNMVGLEVKAAATVTAADFKGLRKVAVATGRTSRQAGCCTTATRSCHLVIILRRYRYLVSGAIKVRAGFKFDSLQGGRLSPSARCIQCCCRWHLAQAIFAADGLSHYVMEE